jgi:hypothetical protein
MKKLPHWVRENIAFALIKSMFVFETVKPKESEILQPGWKLDNSRKLMSSFRKPDINRF